jgi:FG-GAP repeat
MDTRNLLRYILTFGFLLLVSLNVQAQSARGESQAAPINSSTLNTDLLSLPQGARGAISAVIGHDSQAFSVRPTGTRLRAENQANHLSIDFQADGVEMRRGASHWKMSLLAYGRGGAMTEVSGSSPVAKSNRVEYDRGAMTEWYVNGPAGLEQGFTVNEPPSVLDGKPLILAIAVSGNLSLQMNSDRTNIALNASNGTRELVYTGLTAFDATGRKLPSTLEVRNNNLFIQVDDAQAQYPIVIDPWLQEAELTASNGGAQQKFGFSVAISGDTIFVGALGSVPASIYVFTEPSTGWANMTETARLSPSDGGSIGYSLAASGNTVVAGNGGGTAYVFIKPATGWVDMTETAKLTPSDGGPQDNFGRSISVSGSTAVVGSPLHRATRAQVAGAVYVFVEPVTGWTNMTQTAELTPSDPVNHEAFGTSVSISGNAVAASASAAGGAYVFVEPVTGWTNMTQTAKLTETIGAEIGPVAISGNTVAVSGIGAAPRSGAGSVAAYVFVEPLTGWANMTETADLTVTDSVNDTSQALTRSVAISGNTVVAGFPTALTNATNRSSSLEGVVYVFAEPTSGWTDNTPSTAELVPTIKLEGRGLGASVSIDGSTLIAGSPWGTIDRVALQGSAFVYGLQ